MKVPSGAQVVALRERPKVGIRAYSRLSMAHQTLNAIQACPSAHRTCNATFSGTFTGHHKSMEMSPAFQLYFVFMGRKINIFRYVTGPGRYGGAVS